MDHWENLHLQHFKIKILLKKKDNLFHQLQSFSFAFNKLESASLNK